MQPATSSDPQLSTPAPTAPAVELTASQITAGATTRRARRLAAAGAPVARAAEPLSAATEIPDVPAAPVVRSEPVVSVAQPAPVAPVASMDITTPVSEKSTPDADIDVFAAASQAFGFTPVEDDAVVDEPAIAPVATPSQHVAPRRPRGRAFRRVVAAGASFGVMGVAGLIAISMTLPVSAVAASQGAGAAASASLLAASSETAPSQIADEEIQAFVAPEDIVDEQLVRSDSFSTVSMSDLAAQEGIRFSDSLYTNDPDAAIQWPFKVGVSMSSGYGQRWGRLHAGIDLVPGAGAPIQVIADGTVRKATESGGAYGVTAYIDHVIDGKVITSHYAHMQHGSLRVHAGQKVKVGDIIGKVGNTGRSYGAHLHFELIVNGSTIDPLPWMKRNAGRYEY